MHLPLIHACKYYLKEDLHDEMKDLFSHAINGLHNLKQTYKIYDETCSMLTMYENIIDKSINDHKEITKFLEHLIELSEPKNTTDNKIKRMINMKNEIYTQLNGVWSIERLTLINTLFSQLDKKQDGDRQNMFKSIFSILNDCDSDIKNLLKNVSNL